MRYPVIVHKDEGSDYGVTVPDFPGVFSGGETLDEALANVQDAIETFYEGEEVERLPDPSPLDVYKRQLAGEPDQRAHDGRLRASAGDRGQ